MFCFTEVYWSYFNGTEEKLKLSCFYFYSTLTEDPELLGQKGKMLFLGQFFFFNRVSPVAEISLLLNQMYVFVFGLGSYLPAAAASLITNEVQRDETAVSASYPSVFKGLADVVLCPSSSNSLKAYLLPFPTVFPQGSHYL